MLKSSGEKIHIQANDIPNKIWDEAIATIRRYCVSLVIADEDETLGYPCSGVFCVLNNSPGILTARHVWNQLSKAKKLVLMIGAQQPYRIDRNMLNAWTPPPLKNEEELLEASVPDLAFILLSDGMKSDIESRNKVFFSIDKRMSDPSFGDPDDAGFWITIGCPSKLMKRESKSVSSMTYITNIGSRVEIEGWDYIFIDLNLEKNPNIPTDLGGMSGGGLWRVLLYMTDDGISFDLNNPLRSILLQGITFLQTDLKNRQLIAHGPKSIYETFPKWITINAK